MSEVLDTGLNVFASASAIREGGWSVLRSRRIPSSDMVDDNTSYQDLEFNLIYHFPQLPVPISQLNSEIADLAPHSVVNTQLTLSISHFKRSRLVAETVKGDPLNSSPFARISIYSLVSAIREKAI